MCITKKEKMTALVLLSWQWHDGCHYVSFVMYISGAKFEEHCFNISRVILDWVLNCFSGTTYDVITFNTKTWISLKWKKIFQKGKRHPSLLWKAFQISSNYFLLHRHFKAPLVTLSVAFIFQYFHFISWSCEVICSLMQPENKYFSFVELLRAFPIRQDTGQ